MDLRKRIKRKRRRKEYVVGAGIVILSVIGMPLTLVMVFVIWIDSLVRLKKRKRIHFIM